MYVSQGILVGCQGLLVDVVQTAACAAVFSRAPYDEGPETADKFVGWVRDESTEPGFAMVVAYGEGEPIGFAYGYTMPAGRWWRGADRTGPPEVKAADKFAVMEWAVLPHWQGQGIGLRLLDELLGKRPEPFGPLRRPISAASACQMISVRRRGR